MRVIVAVCLCLFLASPVYAAGAVIASVKPLHSLVAAVMDGSGEEPVLLVDGKASPHRFTLKPSQAALLQKADILFYIGDGFEIFLQKPIANVPARVALVPMEKTDGLTRFYARKNKDFEHQTLPGMVRDGTLDPHFWLLADNATLMVKEIARQLAMRNPDKREIYFANTRRFAARIETLHRDLDKRMQFLRDKPFIVFHDAIQYFESDYNLAAAGVIALHPGEAPGAKRIAELRAKIKSLGVVCVFREPSFEGKIVDTLLSGTNAKSGVLDAEGTALAPGPELYFQLMGGIAKGMEDCLR